MITNRMENLIIIIMAVVVFKPDAQSPVCCIYNIQTSHRPIRDLDVVVHNRAQRNNMEKFTNQNLHDKQQIRSNVKWNISESRLFVAAADRFLVFGKFH